MNKNEEVSFGRKRYNQVKMQSLKKLCCSVLPLMTGMLAAVFIIIGFITNYIKYGLFWISFAGIITLVVLTFFLVSLLISRTPYKEVTTDGIIIGVFISRSVGFGNNYVMMHLIINEREYIKQVNLKLYLSSGGDLIFNLIGLAEYFKDKKYDEKHGLNIAKLTQKFEDKKITAVYEKYSNKLAVVVDGKVF